MQIPAALARRSFLYNSGISVGGMALGSLLGSSLAKADDEQSGSDAWRGVITEPHFPPKAKRVIWLYMAGGMSHLDTFDHKPMLQEMDGQPMPSSIPTDSRSRSCRARTWCASRRSTSSNNGANRASISTVWPKFAESCADDICLVRSLHTDAINHDPAHTFMNTGTMNAGRPAMGSWLLYGLGAETDNLPGFVVMVSTGNYGQRQPIAARQWHSGFLQSRFQGVEFRSTGDPVLYVRSPDGVTDARQRDIVDAVQALNQLQNAEAPDPEIATRISQYEMAFRMQTSVPELMDVSSEPQHILDMYGTAGGDGSFASNCLLARRLAERGVRFIQLYHRDWDHHGSMKDHVAGTAGEVDQGVAALITDLKQRDMLKDTIIVFGSEFGRTPMAQGDGRDHHLAGFTMWFAGGGFKPGHSYGATDDFGYHAAEDVVSVHDIHATLLHQLGIDHERFTVKFQGLDAKLTGVEGARVVNEILA